VKITIKYCRQCSYGPRAASLAVAISRAFGIAPQLAHGAGGTFDVTVDEQLIYSKHQTGRFPLDAEVVKLIQQIQPQSTES
jgi:selenoprotein W-related protein